MPKTTQTSAAKVGHHTTTNTTGNSSSSTIYSTSAFPLKRRRITRACDRCHRGGIKCAPGPDLSTCAPCASFGSECTYDRPVKRRGPPARSHKGESTSSESVSSDRDRERERDFGGERDGAWQTGRDRRKEHVRARSINDLSEDEWRPVEVASHEVIEELIEVYHRIAYPIHCYFHWPTFSHDAHKRLYLHNRAFFSVTMAVCAMSAARLRDGAQLVGYTPTTALHPGNCPASETFYDQSVGAIPKDTMVAVKDFNYRRSHAILAMLKIQYGRIREALCHLGDVLSMNSVEGFHNESRWPQGLNVIEVEERRRLCWQIYQLDVYLSVTWGGVIRHRESQITVQYPTEVYDDDEITPTGFQPRPRSHPSSSSSSSSPSSSSQPISFLRGWNFVVDLYRILEHAADRLRARRLGGDATVDAVTRLYTGQHGPDPMDVMNTVTRMYDDLPGEFKRAKEMTGDSEADRYGYTATNIIITMQTLRMVISGTEEANVHQRCAIAAEMLDALGSMPTSYIQSSSAPMLHHLAGVGHLLGSVIQSPVSQHTYLRVRTVLLALADFLATLEIGLSSAPAIGVKLREHVSRIDNYMTEAASSQMFSVGMNGLRQVSIEVNEGGGIALDGGGSGGLDGVGALASGYISPSHANTYHSNTPDRLIVIPTLPTLLPRNVSPIPPPAANWLPANNIDPSQQFQLPEDLFTDWPFDMGQGGEAFDFLGLGGQFWPGGVGVGDTYGEAGIGHAGGIGGGIASGNRDMVGGDGTEGNASWNGQPGARAGDSNLGIIEPYNWTM